MKSIKPGRGPSGMSFAGSVISIVFGVFWTIIAVSITSHFPSDVIGLIFPLCGIIFTILGIINAAYHYKNATGKDRYSVYDITDSSEERDPSDSWIRNGQRTYERNNNETPEERNLNKTSEETDFNFCPYCGIKLGKDYAYCPKCGKVI